MAPPAPTADCLGMSLKLNLVPIAGRDVVIRRCERNTTDPTDDVHPYATDPRRMVGSALKRKP
jgi:hypothetical protein